MPVKKLTETGVAKLQPLPNGERMEFADAVVTGLILRVMPSGVKSWSHLYRFGGKQHRMSLGHYPDVSLKKARALVRDARQDIVQGIDPITQRRERIAEQMRREEEGITVEALARMFIERHCKQKTKRWKDTERFFNRHILPEFGNRRAKDIRRKDVIQFLDKLSNSKRPHAANHVLIAMRKMYNWAIERDELEFNPCSHVKKPVPPKERERVLSRSEIKKLWQATFHLGYPYGPVIKLLLLTGQRRSEISTLRWSHIDFEEKVIRLPAESVKAKRSHEVPLSDMAISVLKTLPRFKGPYVFTTTHGLKPIAGFGKTRRLEIEPLFQAKDWRLHDLRRTAATGMATLGVPMHTISRVLNHAEGGVTRIYARYSFLNEKRQALDLWAQHVHEIVNEKYPDDSVIYIGAEK